MNEPPTKTAPSTAKRLKERKDPLRNAKKKKKIQTPTRMQTRRDAVFERVSPDLPQATTSPPTLPSDIILQEAMNRGVFVVRPYLFAHARASRRGVGPDNAVAGCSVAYVWEVPDSTTPQIFT